MIVTPENENSQGFGPIAALFTRANSLPLSTSFVDGGLSNKHSAILIAQRMENKLFAWLYSQTNSPQRNSLIRPATSICDDGPSIASSPPSSPFGYALYDSYQIDGDAVARMDIWLSFHLRRMASTAPHLRSSPRSRDRH
jgi:hypothetical protein